MGGFGGILPLRPRPSGASLHARVRHRRPFSQPAGRARGSAVRCRPLVASWWPPGGELWGPRSCMRPISNRFLSPFSAICLGRVVRTTPLSFSSCCARSCCAGADGLIVREPHVSTTITKHQHGCATGRKACNDGLRAQAWLAFQLGHSDRPGGATTPAMRNKQDRARAWQQKRAHFALNADSSPWARCE